MIELLAAAVFLLIISLILLYRVISGPSDADRLVAGKGIGMIIAAASIIFSVYSGRSIFLDIVIVLALMEFGGTLLISRYMEDKQ